MGLLPLSFCIPPQYWDNVYIEGYSENKSESKYKRQVSLKAIKEMEQLLNQSCTIESNDDFTTFENKFDPTLVKDAYYFLLALPYLERGMIKDVPSGADDFQTEFIKTTNGLVEKYVDS